jgi:hypothetical protein
MIDEAFDTELETRLRATLAEMIPKLVGSSAVVDEGGVQVSADLAVAGHLTPVRQARRLVGVALAVAATVLGLIVIAGRDTDRGAPGDASPATEAGTPAWYGLIQPSLPERFPYLAMTFATDVQLWFVALNAAEGKSLEIQLASGGYSAQPTTAVDATGDWVETPQGWSVRTPEGLFVSVACGIGIGGRDFVSQDNYCERTSGILPYTKDEIRAVANALATSLTLSIFDQDLGAPSGDPIDSTAAMALISAAVPGQQISATDLGGGSDHIYNVGAGVGNLSPSDTFVPDGANLPPAGTSVRILHGVYPPPPVTGEAASALYEDAAVVSMYGAGGVVVRISTRDSSPASVARLEQLAQDLVHLDPGAKAGPTLTVLATTTTSDHVATLDTPVGDTATTLAPCTQSGSTQTVLVINGSHDNGTAKWWKDLLAVNVPSVNFVEPVNAIAQESTSRVLALAGSECQASLVRKFTTAATVEPATVETLQSLVAQPLPVGTSIVVIVGDDIMAKFTTGVTTTSYG